MCTLCVHGGCLVFGAAHHMIQQLLILLQVEIVHEFFEVPGFPFPPFLFRTLFFGYFFAGFIRWWG